MSCATQIFKVSPTQVSSLITKIKEQDGDFTFEENKGILKHSGVTLDCEYDPTKGELSVTCLSKPFIISCGGVNSRVHDLIESALL